MSVRSGERDVVDRRNGAPDVHKGFGGGLVGGGVDQFHIWGKRESNPDESVSAKGREVRRARAMYPEIVRVDRAEEWIVRLRVESQPELQRLIASLGVAG